MDSLRVEPAPELVPGLGPARSPVDSAIASEVAVDPVVFRASASAPVRSPMANPERRLRISVPEVPARPITVVVVARTTEAALPRLTGLEAEMAVTVVPALVRSAVAPEMAATAVLASVRSAEAREIQDTRRPIGSAVVAEEQVRSVLHRRPEMEVVTRVWE